MPTKNENTIDSAVLHAYNNGIEKNRLRTDLGLIEFARTCELLNQYLPPAPATAYDIGGGYGEYAYYLSHLGYTVYLYDIAPGNIELSHQLAQEYPQHPLAGAMVADARSIAQPNHSADAILLMGPLYHITKYAGRCVVCIRHYALCHGFMGAECLWAKKRIACR